MESILDSFGGGFVKIFSKLTPELVEHEFGGGFASGIFLDQRGFECDAFFLMVLANIAYFSQEGYPADSCLIFSQLLT